MISNRLVSVKIRLFSIIFAGLLFNSGLCNTASARTTGNVLFLYDMVKEDGKWVGESEQRINLGMHGTTGLERLLNFNIGLIRLDEKWKEVLY